MYSLLDNINCSRDEVVEYLRLHKMHRSEAGQEREKRRLDALIKWQARVQASKPVGHDY